LNVRIIGVTLASALFAAVAIEGASWWRSFRFTDCGTATHVIRKIILRQTAIVNHVLHS
jgi:hypothetical protein